MWRTVGIGETKYIIFIYTPENCCKDMIRVTGRRFTTCKMCHVHCACRHNRHIAPVGAISTDTFQTQNIQEKKQQLQNVISIYS